MSDFNPLDRAKIPVHRSSFDLSQKRLFTAKVGEILPVYWQIAIPGTKYRISSDWFTRTVPVNTAAYTRIKEYYDVFAVPLRLLSRQLPQAFTQMSDYSTSAASSTANTNSLTTVPYCTKQQISSLLSDMATNQTRDTVGFLSAYGTQKILNLLDYGNVVKYGETNLTSIAAAYLGNSVAQNPSVVCYAYSEAVNLLPLMAYQKVYYDFFSDNQWEKHLAYAYNVDYYQGGQLPTLPIEMFRLRYANYPKDMFMGMLPSSQYGNVAVLPSLTSLSDGSSVPSNRILATSSPANSSISSTLRVPPSSVNVSVGSSVDSVRLVSLNSDLSALSIRATEFLQRWKEVVQFSSKDYSDQIYAQFGVKAPDYMGNHCHYVGGWSNVININEVVNTNLEASDSQAVIAGKGVGSNSGHTISYDCGAEHCVLICMYHAVPLLDYVLSGSNPQLQVVNIQDFPQPAFDQLGMQPVSSSCIQNRYLSGSYTSPNNVGYQLRYWPWKTSIDRVNGAFVPNSIYKAWSAPLTGDQVLPDGNGYFTYTTKKVRPYQLNSIFEVQIDSQEGHHSVAQDQLLCNVNFQVYAVQNLDRNGLPY